MGVKTIFKVLIGTLACLVAFCLIIESINATVSGNQFSTDLRKSVLTACDYYSQESFRRESGMTGTTMANDNAGVYYEDSTGSIVEMVDSDGTRYGDFYIGTTSNDVYNNIYGPAKDSEIALALGSDLTKFQDYRSEGLYLTPMNLGYVYMDKDTLERIARYTLCRNLTISGYSSGGTVCDMIDTWLADDGDGTLYIKKGGFLVDINSFEITGIDYGKFDLSTSTGRDGFEALTGRHMNNTMGTESNIVSVANIHCDVKIKYVGISVLRQLIEMGIQGVKGLDATEGAGKTTTTMQTGDASGDGVTKGIGADDDRSYSSGGSASKLQGNITYYSIK